MRSGPGFGDGDEDGDEDGDGDGDGDLEYGLLDLRCVQLVNSSILLEFTLLSHRVVSRDGDHFVVWIC